jgi:hypothetical protein
MRPGRKRRPQVTLARTTFDMRSEYIHKTPHSAPIEVENPLNPGQKLILFRNLRDDPLGRMQDRKQISEAQYLAGRRWQRAYETAEISGARAIDPTKEAVDGGQIAQATITDDQAKAFALLASASRQLGMIGESLVRDVLARGLSLKDVAKARGFDGSQRATDYYARLFRDCLDTLAKEFGFSNKGA